MEDRGRGLTRNKTPIKTHIIVLGAFVDNRFTFTGENGRMYEIEISETPLIHAHRILQSVINAYNWEGIFVRQLGDMIR